MMTLDVTSNQVVELSMVAFSHAAKIANYFVVLLALGRVSYLNAVGSKSDSYTIVLRGVVLYFVLIYIFEPILNILMSFPEYFAPHPSIASTGEVKASGLGITSFVPNTLIYVLESLVAVLYYLAKMLYFLLTVLMSAMAPLIFLLGGILQIGLGVETFFSLLIVVSCWPIVFASCDAMTSFIAPENAASLQGLSFELLIVFFKLVGPVAIAMTALSSHAGQAIKGILSAGNSGGGDALSQAQNMRRGFKGHELNHQPRSLTGHAAHAGRLVTHGLARKLGERNSSERYSTKRQSPSDASRPSNSRDLAKQSPPDEN